MNTSQYLISPSCTVKEAISYMEEHVLKALIIADQDRKLLGLFTLGDMRYYFLRNGDLNRNIQDAMNKTPKVFQSRLEAEKSAQKLIIYPIVDEHGIVIDVYCGENRDESVTDALRDVPVVIMAGGKGTRLYPYTKILPKALIPIGDLTITERIINSFFQFGCREFYMILNHKAEMIRAYYQEIEKSYNVTFFKENKFLGTAGGLACLKETIHDTFFVSNCDILLNADLECVYRTHKMNNNKITFVCAMKEVVIPYGVVEADEHGRILSMKEKPEFSFLTNTGVYVLEPEVIRDLKEDEFVHMPELARRYMEKGENVGVFPVSEKAWMDMGQFGEMESMMERLGV